VTLLALFRVTQANTRTGPGDPRVARDLYRSAALAEIAKMHKEFGCSRARGLCGD
jgi:hypothetical protein